MAPKQMKTIPGRITVGARVYLAARGSLPDEDIDGELGQYYRYGEVIAQRLDVDALHWEVKFDDSDKTETHSSRILGIGLPPTEFDTSTLIVPPQDDDDELDLEGDSDDMEDVLFDGLPEGQLTPMQREAVAQRASRLAVWTAYLERMDGTSITVYSGKNAATWIIRVPSDMQSPRDQIFDPKNFTPIADPVNPNTKAKVPSESTFPTSFYKKIIQSGIDSGRNSAEKHGVPWPANGNMKEFAAAATRWRQDETEQPEGRRSWFEAGGHGAGSALTADEKQRAAIFPTLPLPPEPRPGETLHSDIVKQEILTVFQELAFLEPRRQVAAMNEFIKKNPSKCATTTPVTELEFLAYWGLNILTSCYTECGKDLWSPDSLSGFASVMSFSRYRTFRVAEPWSFLTPDEVKGVGGSTAASRFFRGPIESFNRQHGKVGVGERLATDESVSQCYPIAPQPMVPAVARPENKSQARQAQTQVVTVAETEVTRDVSLSQASSSSSAGAQLSLPFTNSFPERKVTFIHTTSKPWDGIMLKNIFNSLGVIIANEVVETTDEQKEFVDVLGSNCAYVARLVDHLDTNLFGKVVSGDGFFGGVPSVLWLAARGISSSFVLKQNSALFPKNQLIGFLAGKFPDAPSVPAPSGFTAYVHSVFCGYSVHGSITKTTRGKCKLMVFDPNCDPFVKGDDQKIIFMNRQAGNIGVRAYPQQQYVQNYHKVAIGGDSNNRDRHQTLNLEGHLPTRCVVFRLLTTLMGMTLCNLVRILRARGKADCWKRLGVKEVAGIVGYGLARLGAAGGTSCTLRNPFSRFDTVLPLSTIGTIGHTLQRSSEKVDRKRKGRPNPGMSTKQQRCVVCRAKTTAICQCGRSVCGKLSKGCFQKHCDNPCGIHHSQRHSVEDEMDCMFGTPKKLEGSTITLRTASNSTGKSGDVHFHLEVHGNTGVINVGTPVCAPSVGLGTPATVVREGGAGKRNAITANNTSVSANKMALFASDAFPGCQGEIIHSRAEQSSDAFFDIVRRSLYNTSKLLETIVSVRGQIADEISGNERLWNSYERLCELQQDISAAPALRLSQFVEAVRADADANDVVIEAAANAFRLRFAVHNSRTVAVRYFGNDDAPIVHLGFHCNSHRYVELKV